MDESVLNDIAIHRLQQAGDDGSVEGHIRQVARLEQQLHSGGQGWNGTAIAEALRLPHNTLLVMTADNACNLDSPENPQYLETLENPKNLESLINGADASAQVVAYCLYQNLFETSEILRIGTAPAWQRQGLAQRLLHSVIEQCHQQAKQQKLDIHGCHLLLEVRADNRPAINLYHKMGFVTQQIRANYYQINRDFGGQAIDAIVMRRDLSDTIDEP